MEFAKTLLSNVWPEWEIVDNIGVGSYGKVYKIKREYIGDREQFAALKVIRIPSKPENTDFVFNADNNSTKEYYKSLVTNIVKEIELMSKVKGQTNIVSYEDHKVIEDEDGLGWTILLRMELLMPFSEYIKTKEIDNKEATRLGIDICKALEVCKKYSIVHRDIKTENVFISETGDFKLGDFGTARTFDKTVDIATMAGTYPYMAPEVMKQEPHGHQSDIYSLGIMLYKLLNKNRFPFYPPYPEEITHDIVQESFRRRLSGEKMSAPCDADKKLSNIILKACEYNRKDRFANATEMRNALEIETVAGPKAFPWKKILRIAACFGAIALIITGIFFGIKFIDKKMNTHRNSESNNGLSENKIVLAYYNLINKMHENPSAYFENYRDNLTGLENNEFAFSDVNGDGIKDLLYNYICSSMAESIMYIWSYDSKTEKTYELDTVSSYSNFYNNGNIRCDLSHNHGYGETIWPYTLMSYNENTNRFFYVSNVYCYDKEYMEERGEVFPAEDDADNDGIIYYIETDEKTDVLTAEEYKEYERKYIPDEALIKLDWKYATEENILAIKTGSPIQHQTNIDSNGNAVNDGLVANDNVYTYYQNHEDNWYLYKTDGNINTRLNTDNTWCINVQDYYIYYANVDDNSTIYKIKKDGTERQKVGSDSCALVIVQGEYIYYKNVSDGDKIYKIGIDGTSRERVSDDSVSYMAIDNGWIYYCNTKDGYIYRIRTDGTGKQQLNDDLSAYLNVYDGWVYYRNDSYNKRIYRMKIDGNERNLFCNDSASYINIYNGKIYYQNISHNNYLYCISIEDAKKTQLNSSDSRYINIADKILYYRIGTDTKTLYMLSLQ